MKIEQVIGKLQEELNQFNLQLNVFEYDYLRDMVITGMNTVNREAINSGYIFDYMYKFYAIPEESITDTSDIAGFPNHFAGAEGYYKVTIPPLLSDIGYKDVNKLFIDDSNASRLSLIQFWTFGYTEDGMNIPIYTVYDRSTLLVSHRIDRDPIQISGFFLFENPTLLPDWNDETSDLPLASEAKLLIFLKKHILSTLGINDKDKGSTSSDNNK